MKKQSSLHLMSLVDAISTASTSFEMPIMEAIEHIYNAICNGNLITYGNTIDNSGNTIDEDHKIPNEDWKYFFSIDVFKSTVGCRVLITYHSPLGEFNNSHVANVSVDRGSFYRWLKSVVLPNNQKQAKTASETAESFQENKHTRGPRPVERTRVKHKILEDLCKNKISKKALCDMKQDSLADMYHTKRSTAVKARDEALSEFDAMGNGNKQQPTATNDK